MYSRPDHRSLAMLTGLRDEHTLAKVSDAFDRFVASSPRYPHWSDAWRAFAATKPPELRQRDDIPRDAGRSVRGKAYKRRDERRFRAECAFYDLTTSGHLL